jgi:uncharacterized DUF497 family protein
VEFEYDPAKSEMNKAKHGIDFESAKALWADPRGIETSSRYEGEPRLVRLAKIESKLWVAIFTYRETNIRIISVRRGRKKEELRYEESTEDR